MSTALTGQEGGVGGVVSFLVGGRGGVEGPDVWWGNWDVAAGGEKTGHDYPAVPVR